jgi:hypothetical protein
MSRVYFAQCGTGGPIKIGKADKVSVVAENSQFEGINQ